MTTQNDIRAQLHASLAAWFERPDQSSMPTECNRLLSALENAAQAWPNGPFPNLLARLRRVVGADDAEAILDRLEVEYARLFLVPSSVRMLPNEYVYAGRSPAQTETELVEIYLDNGLRVGPAARELADHITMELEFHGWLLAQDRVLDAQSFFEEHLSAFHPELADELRSRARNPFHLIVADTLLACLQQETLRLEAAQCSRRPI